MKASLDVISYKTTLRLIKSDLYRYCQNINLWSFIKAYFMIPGFQYSVWMRIVRYYDDVGVLRKILFPLVWYIWACKKLKFGINIPFRAEVGSGLYIGHHGGIIVHPDCIFGRNCNISQGVTLGIAGRGHKRGCPKLGNHVYIGAGAVIIGNITVGNNVAIGANSVVTRDVPDNAVLVGAPAKIVSYKGADDFNNNIDYPKYFDL